MAASRLHFLLVRLFFNLFFSFFQEGCGWLLVISVPEPNYPASSPQLLQRGRQTLGFAEGGTEGPGAVTCPLSPPGHPRGLHPGAGNGVGGGHGGGMRLCPCLPDGRTGSHQGSAGICALTPSPPGRAVRGGQGGGVTAFWGVSSTVLPPGLPSRVILGRGRGTCCLPSQPAAFWHRWVPEHQHQGVLLGEVWGGHGPSLRPPRLC